MSESAPEITFEPTEDGATRANLKVGGKPVSWLYILPFTLRFGAATVRMDGLGGVWTESEHRNRGYGRLLLEATVTHMAQGDAALSTLYGIRDYYPKFGYATAGPDHFIYLTETETGATLPSGWSVRPFALNDLPALRRLYAEATAESIGAVVRADTEKSWKRLAKIPENTEGDACRVVTDPQGQVAAYAWRAKGHWYVGHCERYWPGGMVIGEVIAGSPTAADALLAACRLWAQESDPPAQRIDLALPPEGWVAGAAKLQAAELLKRSVPCGAFMARTLNVRRLFEALLPELQARLRACAPAVNARLRIQTDLDSITLHITQDSLRVESLDESPASLSAEQMFSLTLPQATLARMAFGAFAPDDLLARLETPPAPEAQRLLERLFPPRHPHISLPDRF